MNTETIRDYVDRRLFEPFALRPCNGEKHEVKPPENILILKTRLVIGYPEIDRVVQYGLLHANSIETLQSASWDRLPACRQAGSQSHLISERS